MGAYVYRLALPGTVVEANIGGMMRTPLVGLCYAYKPFWLCGPSTADRENAKAERRYVEPRRRAWQGKQTPPFVAIAEDDGTLREGEQVRSWPSRRVTTYDEPDYAGKRVGTLHKREDGWYVEVTPGMEDYVFQVLRRWGKRLAESQGVS